MKRKVNYKGHVISGPNDGVIGTFSIEGPLVKGGASSVDVAMKAIDRERERCVDCKHGPHIGVCGDPREHGKISKLLKGGETCQCETYLAKKDALST